MRLEAKSLKPISIIIFCLGLVTIAIAFSAKHSTKPAPTGFRISLVQTFAPANGDGQPIRVAIKERFHRPDGSWKMITTYYNPNGTVRKIDVGFGQPGRGVYQINEESKQLIFLSPMASGSPLASDSFSPASFAAALRNSPQFIKNETILGYETVALRESANKDDNNHTEIYYAPELRGLPVKTVFVSDDGVTNIEATSITLGDPGTTIFDDIPDYPISYEQFEDKIQEAEKIGDRGVAESMRKQLSDQQRKQ